MTSCSTIESGREQRLHDAVAGLQALLEPLAPLGLLAQVGAKFVHGVELGGQRGEVVAQLGQLADLDALDGHRAVGRLAFVLASGQRRRKGACLSRGQAHQCLVETFEHGAATDLVGHAGDRVDLGAVDFGRQVQGDEVAGLDGTFDDLEGAEALAQRGDALLEIGLVDLDGVDLDGQRRVVGHGDLGTAVDLGLEGEGLAVLHRDRGDVDLGLAERADVVLLEGLAVEGREGLVDGFLQHRAAAHALVDDPRGHLAATETRHLHLSGDGLVCRVDARLQLVEGHLDGQLDPGRAEGLEGTLHGGYSRSVGWRWCRRARQRDGNRNTLVGRGSRIRTDDLPLPKRTRYQTALYPVRQPCAG